MVKKVKQIRCSKEFLDLVYRVKAKHLMNGQKPPSEEAVTKIIAQKINNDEKWQNELFRF